MTVIKVGKDTFNFDECGKDDYERLEIASKLISAIEYYTELTVEEHMSGKMNKEADKAWKKCDKLITKLVEAV